MVTGAWCYAACAFLGLSAQIVFHSGGYEGQGNWLVQSFEGGQYFGLPVLQLFGMSFDSRTADAKGCPSYPAMIHWLRTQDEQLEMLFLPDRYDNNEPIFFNKP